MDLRPLDFESSASTNFTTPPDRVQRGRIIVITCALVKQEFSL